jgi:hypothetical protein
MELITAAGNSRASPGRSICEHWRIIWRRRCPYCRGKVSFQPKQKNTEQNSKLESDIPAGNFSYTGVVGLLEPINGHSLPNYIMNSYTDALAIIR